MKVTLMAMLLSGLLLQPGGSCPDCTDPTRPWMRGTIEKSCAGPRQVEKLKRDWPGAIVLACECQHQCKPDDERAEETNGRAWDPRCQARCNPANCTCEHPCD